MRVAILRFPGTWSDRDFQHVISNVVGIPADIVWHEDVRSLSEYDAAILPGGFAYGDYLRAGAIARLSPAIAALRRFAASGGLVLGSCNGFQILCEAGMLPGALRRNDHLEFRCEWINLRVESTRTPWTQGLEGRVLRMPIAHGEGNYYVDAGTRERLASNGQIIFRYCDDRGDVTTAANPNGSLDGIAGVCDERGNVLGLMPHPERCSEPLIGGTDGLLVLRALDTGLARPVLSGMSENS
ncbi:MAG: phosphoribosylformylglycinamidine synthase I [Chloroflexi bacterium]|nr:MAG: phosphoribosylformylglycinamidine synthase I [Chloroflexota bacterium]